MHNALGNYSLPSSHAASPPPTLPHPPGNSSQFLKVFLYNILCYGKSL